MMAIPTGVRWHLVVILICISLLTSYVNHLFMCPLVFCMSFKENAYLDLLHIFLDWIAHFFYIELDELCIL